MDNNNLLLDLDDFYLKKCGHSDICFIWDVILEVTWGLKKKVLFCESLCRNQIKNWWEYEIGPTGFQQILKYLWLSMV